MSVKDCGLRDNHEKNHLQCVLKSVPYLLVQQNNSRNVCSGGKILTFSETQDIAIFLIYSGVNKVSVVGTGGSTRKSVCHLTISSYVEQIRKDC